MSDQQEPPELSPCDTATSSALRFTIELVAWVAGPWAAAEAVGSGWVAAPALVVLVGLPAVFNTPGDKKTTGVATPGSVRVAIEMLLVIVAVTAAFTVWPWWAGTAVVACGLAMVFASVPRYRWLVDQPNPWAKAQPDTTRRPD
jgi:hypothetical protein